MTHRFRIGQMVTYRGERRPRDASMGGYQILRFLPQEQGGVRYRIRHVSEVEERTAKEIELKPTEENGVGL